ncbi:MAG TPA: tripartite tricarboxylate transporter substrate binding protein [Burkholderiales bacterium]|nr:tripartite tricarboxylate transporter substrate binding protein [Burkholderiales bacterium]
MFGKVVVVSVVLAVAGPAIAQQYPSKPVRIIVPTAPGGGADFVGRLLAHGLNQSLGQPFIVDNRGGGGTTIGVTLAAKSPPDGYTLLLQHNSLAFNATFYRKLPYDTVKDLAPITLIATQPYIVAVHPSLPVRSVKELVALAKARPGQLAYASGGAGSGPYMGAELLKHAAKIDVLHVPYKGAGPAFADLMSGEVQMMVVTMSTALPHVKSGKVRGLAVSSAKRVPAAPGLPTVAESGVPGYEFAVWYGLFAPAGTPAAIVARLNEEAPKVLAARDVHDKLVAGGLTPLRTSPEEFSALIRRDIAKWAAVVKAGNQYAD